MYRGILRARLGHEQQRYREEVLILLRPATVKDISEATGLPKKTIRAYADQGLIGGKRDFRNWRIFPDKKETLRLIRSLLTGE